MPRITSKKKEYMLIDIRGWITAQMKLNHLRQADVAEALGLTQPRVCELLKVPKKGEKVKEKDLDKWTYGNLLTLFDLFGTSDEEKKRIMTL